MSLRAFHLLFILLVIVGADLFGVWAVWRYTETREVLTLVMGVVSLLGGLGLVAYAVYFVRNYDRTGREAHPAVK